VTAESKRPTGRNETGLPQSPSLHRNDKAEERRSERLRYSFPFELAAIRNLGRKEAQEAQKEESDLVLFEPLCGQVSESDSIVSVSIVFIRG
jgi:hypothetical protein